jgi:hypothetical protein
MHVIAHDRAPAARWQFDSDIRSPPWRAVMRSLESNEPPDNTAIGGTFDLTCALQAPGRVGGKVNSLR